MPNFRPRIPGQLIHQVQRGIRALVNPVDLFSGAKLADLLFADNLLVFKRTETKMLRPQGVRHHYHHRFELVIPLAKAGRIHVEDSAHLLVYAVYLPELFPTSLRSTGVSFCYNIGRIVAAIAPFTIGELTSRLGGGIDAFRRAGIGVSFVILIGIIVLPLMPETKNQPLPSE